MEWLKKMFGLDEATRRLREEKRRSERELQAFRDQVIARVAAIPVYRWESPRPWMMFTTTTDRGARVYLSRAKCIIARHVDDTPDYIEHNVLDVDGVKLFGSGNRSPQNGRVVADLHKRLLTHFTPQWMAEYKEQTEEAKARRNRQEEQKRRGILGRL